MVLLHPPHLKLKKIKMPDASTRPTVLDLLDSVGVQIEPSQLMQGKIQVLLRDELAVGSSW